MPLTEGDVLNLLSDPVAMSMDFWVGPVRVSGTGYRAVRDHIRVENILVVPGNKNLAFYNNQTDILTTQLGDPPPNLDQRALFLHECTHALNDVFDTDNHITRHIDELSAYIAQYVYTMRSNPTWTVGPNNAPWFNFFSSVYNLIKQYRLDTIAGNGTLIGVDVLEPFRWLLVGLPGVNYGDFKKDDPTGANGLKRQHLFVDALSPEEISTRTSWSERETYPDPSDDSLIRTLLEQYAASDVAGYGKRLKSLRRDFALCSLGRARELAARLATRRSGDRLSELFHDRLSTAGRAILLQVRRDRN